VAGFDYSRMTATASRLMSRFAQGSIALTRTTPGEPDPATPWLPGEATTTTYTLDATVAAVTVDQANAKFIDGTTIVMSDLVITSAVPPVAPVMTDTITMDGVAKAIKKIIQLPAAGVAVAYKIFVAG